VAAPAGAAAPAAGPTTPNPLAGIAVGTVASTMNGFSSMAIKRVGVSATPGKTKHFQTLVLSDHLMLCDCPGLVFPNFSASKSELICAGVLSIDTMRGDAVSPVAVIARRVPAAILEGVYGIRFPAPSALGLLDVASTTKAGYVSAVTLLETHARARGFMTDHDRPDVSRSARLLLKQYVSGRVLFAHAPPPAAADEGQAGIGPDVHARKGMLVRAREEAAAAAAAAPDADGAGNGDGADLTAGGDDDLESVMSAAVSSSAMGAGAPARVARGSATTGEAVASAARVQRGKKHPHKSFTRVERSYYPDPQG
jgi:large subunit GTPase 1